MTAENRERYSAARGVQVPVHTGLDVFSQLATVLRCRLQCCTGGVAILYHGCVQRTPVAWGKADELDRTQRNQETGLERTGGAMRGCPV